MTCPCNGKEGIELAICIAPPPGDYDLEIEISPGHSIVINSEGIYIKQIAVDDTLPFTRTIMKKVDSGFLDRIVLKISRKDLPCLAAKALIKASEKGSIIAREKLRDCIKLVEKLVIKC